MTHEWLNIRYSLEKIFTDFLAQTAPAMPFYRFAPPVEPDAGARVNKPPRDVAPAPTVTA